MLRGDPDLLFQNLTEAVRVEMFARNLEIICSWYGTTPIAMAASPEAAQVRFRDGEITPCPYVLFRYFFKVQSILRSLFSIPLLNLGLVSVY